MERDVVRGKLAGELTSIGMTLRKAVDNLDTLRRMDREDFKEKRTCCKEKERKIEELERKIGELEEKVRQLEETGGELEERRAREAERKLEEEMKGAVPMGQEEWEREMEERKACAKRLVLTGMDMGDTKEKVSALLQKILGRRYIDENLMEKKGRDGYRRWFYEMEDEEEKERIIEEKTGEIKMKWNMRAGSDKTYRERKVRQIMDRRAEVERARKKASRIRVKDNKICVDGVWDIWDEMEAKWVPEKVWRKREVEREKKKLEEKIRSLEKEMKEQAMDEGEGEEGQEEARGGEEKRESDG